MHYQILMPTWLHVGIKSRPRRLQEGISGDSWEDLESILETFGGRLGAMLELGERISIDSLNIEKPSKTV